MTLPKSGGQKAGPCHCSKIFFDSQKDWSSLPYETPNGSPKLIKRLNFLNFIDEENNADL